MTKEIQLTKGMFALVDDEDYELVSAFKWYAHCCKNDYYAARREKKTREMIYLHRFLMKLGKTDKRVVDHIDGNTLKCTRNNMRVCSRSKNGMNRDKQENNTSGYKGVVLVDTQGGKTAWATYLKLKGKTKYIGTYETPEDAAISYNHAAQKYFGEFAKYNDVPGWMDIYPARIRGGVGVSGYIGVSKIGQGYCSRINHKGESVYIGMFHDPKTAAIERDKKALELHGKSARLNFPNGKHYEI